MQIQEFINGEVIFDNSGYFFVKTPKDGLQMFLDLRVYGRLKNMLDTEKERYEFQQKLGKFIADAINEKMESETINGIIKVNEERLLKIRIDKILEKGESKMILLEELKDNIFKIRYYPMPKIDITAALENPKLANTAIPNNHNISKIVSQKAKNSNQTFLNRKSAAKIYNRTHKK